MVGGSKKQKRGLVQQIKAKVFENLNQKPVEELERIAKLPAGEILPPEVASTPSQPKDITLEFLVLRFEYLNLGVCKLQGADPTKMKKLLEQFAKITRETAETIGSSGLIRDSVGRNGDYTELFNGLSDDINKLHEIELPGYSRFFGFIVGNKFYIVAVDTVHRNTR